MKTSRRDQASAGPAAQQNPVAMGRIQIMNENWRGKTDPLERRRIQNRLNQRAFRERQRGQQFISEANTPESNDEDGDLDSGARASMSGGYAGFSTAGSPSNEDDELGHTINRNVMRAIVANCQYIGIDTQLLRSASPITTPHQGRDDVPASLVPIKQQHIVPHDPFIDGIPHARFRYNVLRYTASRQIDTQRLGACLRRSGTMSTVGGKQVRDGLIVWSNPENIQNWELSEAFVLNWGRLLEGCEDWIGASNWWRQQRGEPPLQIR